MEFGLGPKSSNLAGSGPGIPKITFLAPGIPVDYKVFPAISIIRADFAYKYL